MMAFALELAKLQEVKVDVLVAAAHPHAPLPDLI